MPYSGNTKSCNQFHQAVRAESFHKKHQQLIQMTPAEAVFSLLLRTVSRKYIQHHSMVSKDKILVFSLWSARPFQGFHGCWSVSIVFHFLLHQFPHLLLQRFPRCKVVDLIQKWFRFSSLPGMQWLVLELLDQPIGSIYDSALVFEVPTIIWQNLRTLSLSPLRVAMTIDP